MTSFAEIQTQLKYKAHTEFGNLEARCDNGKRTEYQIACEAKYLARQQILHLMGSGLSVSEEMRHYREYFKQQISGEYLRLPINRRGNVNLQRSKALRKLLKEGFIKMERSRGSFRYSLHRNGWKPYGAHQTYLTLADNNVVHKTSFDV